MKSSRFDLAPLRWKFGAAVHDTTVGTVLACIFVVAFAADVARPAGQRGAVLPPAGAPESTVRFENVASAAGLDFQHVNGATAERYLPEIMSGGGLFFDYDNDGWPDVFLVDGGSFTNAAAGPARHRLYRNRGNGTFEDVMARSGITHKQYGLAPARPTTTTTAGPTCT